jgi:tetrahydromethanopterin S-methyltransferase subunit C
MWGPLWSIGIVATTTGTVVATTTATVATVTLTAVVAIVVAVVVDIASALVVDVLRSRWSDRWILRLGWGRSNSKKRCLR